MPNNAQVGATISPHVFAMLTAWAQAVAAAAERPPQPAAPDPGGAGSAESLGSSLDLAQHAERWGYHRYSVAERHNRVGIAKGKGGSG